MIDKPADYSHKLQYRANDKPHLTEAIFCGFQQAMCGITGLLVSPFIVAEILCAGSGTVALRVKLISTTLLVSGLATLLQTTFGLRLAILQGTSFAFIPPLLAFSNIPKYRCNATNEDFVDEQEWSEKMQTIQGSLLVSSFVIVFLGSTGIVGTIAKLIGPITICPILSLLALQTMPVALEKISSHWIGIIQILVLLLVAVYLADFEMVLPTYSFKKNKMSASSFRIFGRFPYLISIGIVWILCVLLTVTGLEKKDGAARIDKNQTMLVLHSSPWLELPYPGQFGMLKFDIGLFLGFLASCIACVFETLGSYNTIGRISQERTAPSSATNRAILCEGVSCSVAAVMGICVGITTYTENIALISITKTASRFTMQIAGMILIFFGLFTKTAGIMATIPDACVGAIFLFAMSVILGVGISNLQAVDLKLSRNVSIIGFSILSGTLISMYFRDYPINTGIAELDQVLNMLLTLQMFVGGIIAFFLDNSVHGATKEQRGLAKTTYCESTNISDGYKLPLFFIRILKKIPILSSLPFLPLVISQKKSTDNSHKNQRCSCTTESESRSKSINHSVLYHVKH